jgi:hypothetical protein
MKNIQPDITSSSYPPARNGRAGFIEILQFLRVPVDVRVRICCKWVFAGNAAVSANAIYFFAPKAPQEQ